jgi:hypothetical protein
MGEVLRELFLPGGILFVPFLVGCMGSVAFGIVGSYVTVRRLNSSAVAISHSVLAGIGLAVFLHYRYQWAWCTPLLGAFLAAVVSALIIGRVTLRARHLGDSVTSSVMVIGMAAGLLLLKKTPGYFEPMSVLFGDTLLVSSRDLWVIGGIDALAVFCGTVFYRRLLAICFDRPYRRRHDADCRHHHGHRPAYAPLSHRPSLCPQALALYGDLDAALHDLRHGWPRHQLPHGSAQRPGDRHACRNGLPRLHRHRPAPPENEDVGSGIGAEGRKGPKGLKGPVVAARPSRRPGTVARAF